MSTLSTHVLDTGRGDPAAGMVVRLEGEAATGWQEVSRYETDDEGRVAGFGELPEGRYRLAFETGGFGNELYPVVFVVFEIDGERDHYHMPLLLSPYGYTTYRGS